MTAFPSDRRPKAQRHATNEPSLPPQRQNLWDIWLGNTQSEFRASPLCLFSSVNISLPLCKKTNYSPPFYCLFKLAWPPRSRPQSIPSSVRARGLKAHLVHSFTSQSVCVFVSPPSLKGRGGGHTPYGISDECWGGQYMFSVMLEVRGAEAGFWKARRRWRVHNEASRATFCQTVRKTGINYSVHSLWKRVYLCARTGRSD